MAIERKSESRKPKSEGNPNTEIRIPKRAGRGWIGRSQALPRSWLAVHESAPDQLP
jgi:hypothetical protein